MDRYKKQRTRMVETQIKARDVSDVRVLRAMAAVPRHLFVDEGLIDQAYNDSPLPIGEHQTISQPYIVALMTEALELQGKERVLEIGTGSGYQTAVLACLADRVFSVERIASLATNARRILDKLNLYNIAIRVGDGLTAGRKKLLLTRLSQQPQHRQFLNIWSISLLPVEGWSFLSAVATCRLYINLPVL